MSKAIITVFSLAALLLSFTLTAEEIKLHRATKLTPEVENKWLETLQTIEYSPARQSRGTAARAELGRTWYDYATNTVMGRMLSKSTNGVHFAFMKIFPQTAERFVTYDFWDDGLGLFIGNQSVTEDRRTGWGRVVTGRNDEAIVALHADPAQVWFDAAEQGYFFSPVTAVTPGVFPGIARLGDNLVFLSQIDSETGWGDGGNFRYSTDYGLSWESGENLVIPGVANHGNGERWPTFNPVNPPELSHLVGPDSLPDFPDGSIHKATTSDWGANWDLSLIWDDNFVFVADSSAYIIENFTQMNGMYTQDGTYHAVFGAVQGIRNVVTSELIDMFPILYWNDREQQMVWLTDQAASVPSDTGTINGLADFRPGNGLGNAYPILSEGPDGDLLAIWQQWEDDGSGGLVTVFPSGGSTDIFMTDIWGAYSPDGGLHWSKPFFVAGTPGESDVYPNTTDRFASDADSVYLEVLYMYDSTPSVSFSDFPTSSAPNEAVWYYERVGIARQNIIVGIEDLPVAVADDFALSQNYPNPFNPATTIQYTLKKTAEVTLEVYNLTGQKVATLVKDRQTAGEHSITFDAAQFSSGIYFYTLRSGDVQLTKKMVLLK